MLDMELSRASWIPRPSKATFLFFFFAELSAVRIELKFRSVVTTLMQESKALPPKEVRVYTVRHSTCLRDCESFRIVSKASWAGLNCSFFHPRIVDIVLCSYRLLGQKSMFYFMTLICIQDLKNRFHWTVVYANMKTQKFCYVITIETDLHVLHACISY